MTVFCYKKMDNVTRLGERFRQKRESLNMDLPAASLQSHVPIKYLEALESSVFGALPQAKVHRLAYVRAYAELLELTPESCLGQFECEDGLAGTAEAHPLNSMRGLHTAAISIFLRNGALASLVFIFAGYLLWQVNGIVKPPLLAVYAPIEGHIFNEPSAVIMGETEKESHLTVNGAEIMVSEQGHFETKIDLIKGVNTITVVATKKHGKTSTVVRHLVVQERPGQQISLR